LLAVRSGVRPLPELRGPGRPAAVSEGQRPARGRGRDPNHPQLRPRRLGRHLLVGLCPGGGGDGRGPHARDPQRASARRGL